MCTYMALANRPPTMGISLDFTFYHALAFGFLTVSLGVAHYRGGWRGPALWMIAYGIVIEGLQLWIPERAAEALDLLLDGVGIALGVLVLHRLGGWLVHTLHGCAEDRDPGGADSAQH